MAFPLVSRSFFVTLSSITTSHEVFGCQSLMKNVAIVLLSMYSLLRNGVTLKSETQSGGQASDYSPLKLPHNHRE